MDTHPFNERKLVALSTKHAPVSWFFITILLTGLLLTNLPANVAHAAGIVVNSLADTTTPGDGNCTLREAINNANGDSDTTGGDCASGSGSDNITFNLSGTITLGSQLPAIYTSVTINGNGHGVAVSGNDTIRVLAVLSGGSLTISHITVQNGLLNPGNGGGIYNQGTLVVTSSIVSNCTAQYGGGIFNDSLGTATVMNSTVADNTANRGGGIYNYYGTMTVADSTLVGNNASNERGGGIMNYGGNFTVSNSTFSGNSALDHGGGVFNQGTLVMTHSTLTGNSSSDNGGTIFNEIGGNANLAANILEEGADGWICTNVATLNDNGYNLASDASCIFSGTGSQNSVTLNLSALANNGGPTQTHLPGTGSAAIDLIPNGTTVTNSGISYTCNQNSESLDTDQRGQPRPFSTAGNCDAGSVEATDFSPKIPSLLLPINGSSIMDTMPTFDWEDVVGATQYQIQVDDNDDFSSPAIDTTMPVSIYTHTSPLTDGTNYWRVRASNGLWSDYSTAWTVTIDPYIHVNTTSDVIATDGFCSLREAIRAANLNVKINECPAGSSTDTDTILLANVATYNLTILGANEDAALTGDLDIVNNTAATDLIISVAESGTATIDASGIFDRVLHILSGATAEINGVTIQGGNDVKYGGGIYNTGTLILNSCRISNNIADGSLGGLYGGGIYNGGTLIIQSNSTIDGNAASYGGGIYSEEGSSTIIDTSIIRGNGASIGGGIYNDGTTTMNASTIGSAVGSGNSAYIQGGGIYNRGPLNLTSCKISGNTTPNNLTDEGRGGGIYNDNTLTLDASTVSNNIAFNGGGINNVGNLTIQNGSTIGGAGAGNSATYGGGIYNFSGMTTIESSTVTFNVAHMLDYPFGDESGGGIYNYAGSTIVNNSEISANSADYHGGGILNQATLTIQNGSTIGGTGTGNSAYEGAGIYNEVGTITVTGSRFLENSASNNGSAVYNSVAVTGAVNVTGSCIVGNRNVAIYNHQSASQTATGNWWGHGTGPGTVGPGVLGDTVSNNVDFSSFLTTPILDCPTISPKPALLSPANASGTTDHTPDFDWSDVSEAIQYQIQVDDNTDFSSPVIDTITTTSTYTPTSPLDEGTYYWRVQSSNGVWSGYSNPWVLIITHYIQVTTTDDVFGMDGFCSFREAISSANLNTAVNECPAGRETETDTILLANSATYNLTIDIIDNTSAIDLTIIVAESGRATLGPSGSDRVLNILSGATVEINGVKISGGSRVHLGGGIYNLGTLTLNSCTISDNNISSYSDSVIAGGGIYNAGTLILDASIVNNNRARNGHGDEGTGGGIYNSGTLIIRNGSTIGGENWNDGNHSDYGGAIYNSGTLTIQNTSTFKHNMALYGGGIYNSGNMIVDNITVSANEADIGGGIYNAGTLTIQNGSTVGGSMGNKANYGGGGIYNSGILLVSASSVSGNYGGDKGGGIRNAGTTTIENNSTIGGAGAFNSALIGGGIHNSGTLTIDTSAISGNIASYYGDLGTGLGGGIYNLTTLVIRNGSTIGGTGTGNSAYEGGGIYNKTGTITMTDSRFIDNSATGNGDAIYNEVAEEGAVSVTGSCIVNNGSVAFYNDQSISQIATGNWWGHSSGPGPVGSGVGDMVSGYVDFSGFLTTPILGCPTLTLFTISGNVGVAGVTLSYTDGTPRTATADSSGNYAFTVSNNWSGAVTPSKIGYAFAPANKDYVNVAADQVNQDYTTTAIATFLDVPTSYWAWNYIERLYAAGITGGCGTAPLIYCPETAVSRGQMAVFLERGMKGSSYSPPPATGTVFGDIPASYWSASWIEKLYADGITGGCGGGNYCPEASVTRAQMAVFLLRAKHGASYSPPPATGDFGDVPTSYWAASWIEQLTAEGITSGCGGGNYCPEQPVSRAQMAVFLVRTFGLP